MWLTGFDCPSLHTLYIDKPMRGHGLMQAIARVNRVFHDKRGGLVVDYLGLAEVRGMPQRNLAVELLRKLLEGEIKVRRRKNVVQARSFAEMLEQAIRRYQNRAVEAVQVVEELIALAKEMREADRRGEQLGLSEEELAFYDALVTYDSAVKVLGEPTLKHIAQELVETVRHIVTIDWTERENVRANLRRLVKRVLRKYSYPPDKQEKATETVLEQAEVLSERWAVAA
jgi:type I restriction enzyme R subunit